MNAGTSSRKQEAATAPSLSRSLSLTHATLYGLGVTIGAGIYVLVGAAALSAGRPGEACNLLLNRAVELLPLTSGSPELADWATS